MPTLHTPLTQARIWLRAALITAEAGGPNDDKAAEQLATALDLLGTVDPETARYAEMCARAEDLAEMIAYPKLRTRAADLAKRAQGAQEVRS